MRSDRSYGSALSEAGALAELRRCAGTQFDATVVAAFAEAHEAAAAVHTGRLAA